MIRLRANPDGRHFAAISRADRPNDDELNQLVIQHAQMTCDRRWRWLAGNCQRPCLHGYSSGQFATVEYRWPSNDVRDTKRRDIRRGAYFTAKLLAVRCNLEISAGVLPFRPSPPHDLVWCHADSVLECALPPINKSLSGTILHGWIIIASQRGSRADCGWQFPAQSQ
jgi:hypothetical protein